MMAPDELLDQYKNWAVVGVTPDEEKYGYKIFHKLKDHGYNVYGINPKYEEVDGIKLYKSLSELPEKVDVVNFVVNPKVGMGVVEECAKLGIQHIWLQPGTISDELLGLAEEKEIEAVQACVLVALSYRK
jgi:hypothetical protein